MLNPMSGTACNVSYGIATWIWHTDAINWSQQSWTYYQNQGAEPRGILCLVGGIWGSKHTACSTHLEVNRTTALAQMQEAIYSAENMAAAHWDTRTTWAAI